MKAPQFWTYGSRSLAQTALLPFSCLYNSISSKRANKRAQYKARIPVICIGNLIMGGAGKTPTAIAIAQELILQGKKVVFLSRGYGGSEEGPVLVEDHSVQQVGDEPLLLKQTAPVCISKDRVKGAKFCEEQGFDVILMDDGFQNPALHKDCSLLIIDGGYGHGNEKVFPAGPLREDLESGLKRADGIIMIGSDETNCLVRVRALSPDIQTQRALIQADPRPELMGQKVIAFAGIGRPKKFYQTAKEMGCQLCATVDYKDHHHFSEKDLKQLRDLSAQLKAQLITTEKDWVRLPKEMQKEVEFLKISLAWQPGTVLNRIFSVFEETAT